jgi:hypothetical protein
MVGGIIMRETKKWTKEEETFVRNNYTDLNDYEIGELLNRTYRSIRVKRHRLGLFIYYAEQTEPIKGEKWVEYEGLLVSNKGRIKKDDSRYLTNHIHKTGYVVVSFNGSNKYLHTIIWKAFMGEIPDGYEIDHKDCNKTNNALYNLELVTHSENMRRAYYNGCFTNFFGREPLTTIPQGSTPKQVEVPSTVTCNDDGEDIV